MTLTIAQEARRIENSRWEWAVRLEGSPAELDDVVEVVYTLHSSLSQPVRVVSDRRNNFRLSSRGWVSSNCARAKLRTRATLELTHWLRLEADHAVSQRGVSVDAPSQVNVFVSSKVADEPFAEDLRQALQAQGFNTLAVIGSSWTDSMEQTVTQADGLVMLVTGRISPWMEEEARLFARQGKPVVPVLANGAIPESPDLQGLQALQVKWGPERKAGDAEQIAQRVREILSEHP